MFHFYFSFWLTNRWKTAIWKTIYCKFALFLQQERVTEQSYLLTLSLGFQVIQKENPAHMNLQVNVIVVSQMT